MKAREDLPVMNGAIYLRYQNPVNREQKREALHEYDRIVARLWPIEKAFCEKVFEGVDYSEAYHNFLDWWSAELKGLQPKLWLINEWYFSETFGLIEHETDSVFPGLHEKMRSFFN